jgi:O-antigen ligase
VPPGKLELEWKEMNTARSADFLQKAKTLVGTLLLIIVLVAMGVYLGNWIHSPNWQSAMRVAIMGGLAFVILINPLDGLLLWMIIAPFGEASWTEIWRILNFRMPPGIPDLTPDRLAIALLTVFFIAQLGVGKRRLQRPHVEVFMVLFCIMVLPAAASGYAGLNKSGQLLLDRFIAPFLVFVLAKNLYEDETTVDKLGVTLGIIALYICAMIAYEHWTGQPLFVGIGRTTAYTRSLRKIVSLLGNPAFLGTVLGMITPIALHRFVHQRSLHGRFLFGLVFLMTLLGNFYVYNRGAWLALFAGLVTLLIERKYRRLLLPIILIGAALALVYWQVISASAIITERLSNVNSIRFRLTMLQVSQSIVRDHLLFGAGLGNFPYYFIEYGGHWETLAYDLPTPHNSYVLVFTEMGLVSFVPYALIFVSMFWRMAQGLRRTQRDEGGDSALLASGLATLAVYAVSAAAVDLYINVFTSLVFFLISGIIMGYLNRLPRHRVPSATPPVRDRWSEPAESGRTALNLQARPPTRARLA